MNITLSLCWLLSSLLQGFLMWASQSNRFCMVDVFGILTDYSKYFYSLIWFAVILCSCRKIWISWWPTSGARSPILFAASSLMRPRLQVNRNVIITYYQLIKTNMDFWTPQLMFETCSAQGSWMHFLCCTSCAVTACWKASGSAGRAFLTGSSTPSSSSGKICAHITQIT